MNIEWFNSYYWLGISFVFVLISLLINKFFRETDKRINTQMDENERIKKIKYKSLDDQKTYLKNKTDLGKDFIYMVLTIMLFYLGFRLLILPRIPGFWIGIICAVLFASLFAYFMAEYVYPEKYFVKNFVNKFLNILFIGSFASYVKFFETIHVLLLVLFMLIIMISTSWLWNKYWGKKK
jgi:hypothetical protein